MSSEQCLIYGSLPAAHIVQNKAVGVLGYICC